MRVSADRGNTSESPTLVKLSEPKVPTENLLNVLFPNSVISLL